jgi:hypothetical protein
MGVKNILIFQHKNDPHFETETGKFILFRPILKCSYFEIRTCDFQFWTTLYMDLNENIFIRKHICDLVGTNIIS